MNGLTGTIPPSLGNLTQLPALTLSSNQLSGAIPPELGDLVNLTDLHLQLNDLTGSIPADLGDLTNLHNLSLSQNELTGPIPTSLGNLGNLRNLSLEYNHLTGSIPPGLGSLANLQTLTLQANQFDGSIPSELSGLQSLITLMLNSNKLSGAVPASLAGLTNLATLRVDFNSLAANDPDLLTFLNAKNPGWELTQTVAPTQITATALAGANVLVSWLPIPYTGDGGSYRVFISETSGSGYTLAGQTANKTESSVQINGLTPGVTYYFVVQTHTEPNPNNQSALDSENSTEAIATAWQQLSVNILGTVTLGGVPLTGVVMVGLPDGTVTDALGTYSATVDVDFSGTVTPAFAGHTFNPLSRTYTHVTADETAQDYAATLNTHTISGTVTPAIAGVVINGLPGTPVTLADGTYTTTVDYGFDGTATPTLAGYAFTPAYRTYSDISANQLVQNYTASVLTFTLTYTAGANGTITGTSPQTVNYGADGSSVTAVPNTGYHFVDWSDGVLTAARTDTNVTANLSVTANFAIRHVYPDLYRWDRRHDHRNHASDGQLWY